MHYQEVVKKKLNSPSGFIYVLTCEGSNRIKIGFSKNPEARLKQLQTAAPGKLEIACRWPTRQYYEHLIHSLLSRKRRHLEWFEMSAEEAIAFINKALGIEPNSTVDRTTEILSGRNKGGLWKVLPLENRNR